jgi:hypothetical protein
MYIYTCYTTSRICTITEGFQPQTSLGKNTHGAITGDEKGILEVWAGYFKELSDNLDKG